MSPVKRTRIPDKSAPKRQNQPSPTSLHGNAATLAPAPKAKVQETKRAAGSRRKSRELTLQMLYQCDLAKQSPAQVETLFWATRDDVDNTTRNFAQDLFRVATARAETIDSLIVQHAKNWRIERMPAVDRNLLRMAIAEMLGYPRTPGPIVINEAIEIARRYAAPESVHFLNGVLDAVGQSLHVPAVTGPREKPVPAEKAAAEIETAPE